MRRGLVASILLTMFLAFGCSTGSEHKDESLADDVRPLAQQWQSRVCEGADEEASNYVPSRCRQLDAAATKLEVDHSEPAVAEFLSIWRRVYEPYYSLTGRETIMRLVPAQALGDAVGDTPAVVCPGPTPIVYFSRELIDEALVEGRYPPSFLAFIAGHELGHRINDFTCSGARTHASLVGGTGIELLADLRAAFFVTTAGFSTRELVEANVVDDFLRLESRSSGERRAERRAVLVEALEMFPQYEAIYQNALTLSLAGEDRLTPAARLVGWADELMSANAVSVPEFKILRAIALMRAAIPDAPWQDDVGYLSQGASSLRCAPILASHTALADDIRPQDALMGRAKGNDERRRAVRDLNLALDWLTQAENRFGANPFITANLRACVQFYLSEPHMAKAEHRRAMQHASEVPEPIRQALTGNAALIDFQMFIEENRRPGERDEAFVAWKEKLSELREGLSVHPKLAQVIAHQLEEAEHVSDEVVAQPHPESEPVLEGVGLPKVSLDAPLGTCPDGMKATASVPRSEQADARGITDGVTFCQPIAESRLLTLSRVRVPGADEPPYRELRVDIASIAPPATDDLDNLRARCPLLHERAVAPDGTRVFSGPCDGLFDTVVYVAGEQIQRIDVILTAMD